MEINRLFDFVEYQLEKSPRKDSLVSKVHNEWIETSTQEYISKANAFSRGLLQLGIKPQDKIAIVTSTNRTEWNICDIGMQQVGAISVPLYPTLSEDSFEFILNNSEAKLIIVSDKNLYDTIYNIKHKVSSLVGIYSFDNIEGVPNYSEIINLGEDTSVQYEVDSIKNLIKTTDVVTLIYTSGTTGKPKGVVLTHENIVSDVLMCKDRIPIFPENPIALSFLPINHVFERMLIYLYHYLNIGIWYAESIDKLGDNMKEVKPHIMTVVPRLVEKVYDKIYLKGSTTGGLKTKIFMWALSLVEDYEPYKNNGLLFSIKHSIAKSLVFSKWKESVGGNLVCMISGSAPLATRLNHIFWGAGIPILEGYGLTETSPVISVNCMKKSGLGIGTVGAPLIGVDVKIAEDGEILVKGPNVTKGYFNDPEKTAEAFTVDGYFMTGDIGIIENGLLKITDRKKEMFKTSGGKYIAPQIIENIFKQSRFIEQIMVVGEGEKMPCVIIQPNFQVLKNYLEIKNLPIPSSNEGLINDPHILDVINREIIKMNQELGNWEKIKKFELTPNEWTIDDGLLTPTLKLKRKNVLAKYKYLYNKMYNK
ncbi:long-chain fatty acid--CoA ligase [Chishuiella sp.]|uniref:AMP-dependent synthetase/ligase n=1 Tax=Chishuiella sp. TaxID=1969467 RepID=UPI0028A84B5E|nr:long-chain fatty acid--CoA ligase [Chishuiella sp.]